MRTLLAKLAALLASLVLTAPVAALLAPWNGRGEVDREARWLGEVEDYQLRLHVGAGADPLLASLSCPPERGPAECQAVLRAVEAREHGTPVPSWLASRPSLTGLSGKLRARRLLALAALAALLGGLAAVPAGRRQLARVWPAPIAGLLWAGGLVVLAFLAAAIAPAAGSAEGALPLVLLPLALGPWAAAAGAAWSCGRRVPERSVRVVAAAALCGAATAVPLALWGGIGIRNLELYALLLVLAALTATAAGALAAATGRRTEAAS